MPTFATYYRTLARALDDLGVYAVTSTTSTTAVLTNLQDSTTNASTARYNARWAYHWNSTVGPQQRRVKGQGFVPLTGQITLELFWSVQPTVADEIALTSLFPVIESVPGEDTSYRTLVNRALAHLAVPDTITTAITTGDTYSTATWPWLDRDARIRREADGRWAIYEPAPVSGRHPVNCHWRGWELEVAGTSTVLHVAAPFSSASGNLTVDVRRPGNTLISGAESTVGFGVGDTETALPAVEDVVTVGLWLAYEALAVRALGAPDGVNWAARAAQQRERAEGLLYWDRSQVAPAPAAAPAARQAAA